MMRLAIGSEAMFFISLIFAYLYFSSAGDFRAAAINHLDIRATGLFTLFLLSSSFTFWRAEKNYQRGKTAKMKAWLGATILLGSLFIAGQGHEYYKLMEADVTISKSGFGSGFFTLTGFHGLHVLIGLILLTIILTLVIRGFFNNSSSSVISVVGIYWHFVDVVWIFVFTVVYVLPYIT